MIIAGLETNTKSLNSKKAPLGMGISKDNFNQLLSNIENQFFPNKNMNNSKQSNSNSKTKDGVLVLKDSNNPIPLNNGNDPLLQEDKNSNNVNLTFFQSILKLSDQIWSAINGGAKEDFSEGLAANKLNDQVNETDNHSLQQSNQQFSEQNSAFLQLLNLIGEMTNVLGQKASDMDVGDAGKLNGDQPTNTPNKDNHRKDRTSSLSEQLISQLISQLNGNPSILNEPKLNELLMKWQGENESSIPLNSKSDNHLIQEFKNASNIIGQSQSEGAVGEGSKFSVKSEASNSYVLQNNPGIESKIASLLEQSGQQNESMFPIKTTSLNSSYLNQNRVAGVQNVDGLKAMNQSVIFPNRNSNNQSSIYLGNTFSQVIKEINSDSDKVAKTGNSRSLSSNWNNGGTIFFQQMSKQEQFVLMTQGSNKAPSVNDMIQQFESILSKSQFSKMGGTQKLFINLHPESLGSLRIELIQKDQTTVARIMTTTEAAKDALQSHLQNLKDAFAAQNIPINKVEIGTQLLHTQQTRFSYDEQQQQQQQRSYQENQPKDRENDKEEDTEGNFILSLDEVLLNKTV